MVSAGVFTAAVDLAKCNRLNLWSHMNDMTAGKKDKNQGLIFVKNFQAQTPPFPFPPCLSPFRPPPLLSHPLPSLPLPLEVGPLKSS